MWWGEGVVVVVSVVGVGVGVIVKMGHVFCLSFSSPFSSRSFSSSHSPPPKRGDRGSFPPKLLSLTTGVRSTKGRG